MNCIQRSLQALLLRLKALEHIFHSTLYYKATVKLFNIVDSTLLLLPTTSLFLFSKVEINNRVDQQCWAT